MASSDKARSMADILPMLIEITQSLRSHPEIKKASAGRGALAFFELVKSFAALNGRLTKDHIKKAALITLSHRIVVNSLRSPAEIVEEVIDQIFDKGAPESVLPSSEIPLIHLDQPEKNELLKELMNYIGQKKRQQSANVRPTFRSPHPELPLYFTRGTGFTVEDLEKIMMINAGELETQYPTLAKVLEQLKRLHQSQTPTSAFMRLLYTLPNQLERLVFLRGMTEHSWHPSAIFEFTPMAIDLIGKDMAEKLLGGAYRNLVSENQIWHALDITQTITDADSRTIFRELLEAIQTLIDQRGTVSPQSLLNVPKIRSIIEQRLREKLQIEPNLLRYDHLLAAHDELKKLLEGLQQAGYLKFKDSIKLTTTAYALLFEELVPEVEKIFNINGDGHRSEHVRRQIGERSLDVRNYKIGDSFRDISIRRTIRTLVRNRKQLDALERKDFQIYQKEPITNLAIIFALDTSSSMAEFQKLYYARKAAVGLALAAQQKGDKVGVVVFSDHAHVLTQPMLDVNLVLSKIFQQVPIGNTNIQEALSLARELLLTTERGNGVHKHIIMLSDGVPTTYSVPSAAISHYSGPTDLQERKHYAYQAAARQAKLCRRHEISLSVVCIRRGRHVDENFARKLAEIGQGSLYSLEDESYLLKATLDDYLRIRDKYIAS